MPLTPLRRRLYRILAGGTLLTLLLSACGARSSISPDAADSSVPDPTIVESASTNTDTDSTSTSTTIATAPAETDGEAAAATEDNESRAATPTTVTTTTANPPPAPDAPPTAPAEIVDAEAALAALEELLAGMNNQIDELAAELAADADAQTAGWAPSHQTPKTGEDP